MNTHFKNIKDLSLVKQKCVFCNSNLKCILTNYSRPPGSIPLIKSFIENDVFCFDIEHTSPQISIKFNVTVDANENTFSFKIISVDNVLPNAKHILLAKDIFLDYSPHIELVCFNKKCKKTYYLSSHLLKLNNQFYNIVDDSYIYKAFGPSLYSENFIFNNYIIMNFLLSNQTFIYSNTNIEADPIKIPLINLECLGAEKALTRIQTIVTFG